MPKLRLDQLPLDRRKQATSGEGIINKRETDPNIVGEVAMRHGSERQDSSAPALGLIAEGYKSFITNTQTFTATGDFTALFNLKWGSIAQEGSYPILTLRAGTANTHWYQLYLNRTGDDLKFGLRAADSDIGSARLQQTGTLTANSSAGIALKRVANRLSVFVDGVEKGYIADVSGDSPTGPFYIDLLGTAAGINGFESKPSIGITHPIISNFKIDASDITVSNGDDVVRLPGSFDYHWKLDGTHEAGFIQADTGANSLTGIPSKPQVDTRDTATDAALRFNGLTGGLLVRHDPSLDWYFSSFINSAPASAFGFHIEGTRAKEPVDKETCLIDYGGTDGLCKLVIKSDGAVKFTMNEISVTTDNAQFTSHTDEYAFKIFCGRGKNALGQQTLYIRSEVPGNSSYLVEEKNNTATNYTPFLDLNAIPNIYVGTEAAPNSEKRFKGSLTKVAMYPSYYTVDAGQSLSEFSFDLTTESLIDGSPHNRRAELIEHFMDESVSPLYAQGGIPDADFIAVEAGVVLSASGPKNYNSKLTRRISDDVTSSRLGQLTFLESDGEIHVINKRTKDARTLGIPAPTRLVSQQALGGGSLQGAYNYSYRYISDLGTNGPLLKLDPVKTSEASRIMLGRPTDPSWSALGETYLITEKDTGQHGVVTGDAPPENTAYPLEVYSRCGTDLDDVELKETVWHRGAKCSTASGWRSNSTAIPIQTAANWTMQYAFRLGGRPGVSKYGAICGMGPSGGYWPNWTERNRYRTVDFGAYLDYANYGSDNNSGGRLVVIAGRRDHAYWEYDRRDQWYESGSREYVYVNNSATYKALTFTNDGDGWWTAGAYYSVYFVKMGEALKVYCKKYADENAEGEWKVLEGRTNMSAGTTADNFFSQSHLPPVQRSVTGFGFNMMPRLAAHALNMSGSGRTIGDFGEDRIGEDATPDPNQYIREHGSWHVHFHARVWKYGKTEHHLKNYGEDMFAALEGGDLHSSIMIDWAPVVSDDEFSTGVITARINEGSIPGGDSFSAYRGSDSKTCRGWEMGTERAGTALAPREIALMCIGDKGNDLPNVAGKAFLTDIGDGSLVVQIGHKSEESEHDGGRWMICEKLWAEGTQIQENSVSRETHPFINSWDKFNWISTLVYFNTSAGGSDTRALGFDSLCINGNKIFSGNLGLMDSSKQRVSDFGNGYIWLGNDAANTNDTAEEDLAETVHTGEFRLWKEDQGPDPTTGYSFNYLYGRVSENEFVNMDHYYKFQPDDYAVDTENDWDATVFDYAVSPVLLRLYDNAILNRDSDDAATGISFPISAHETIASIEIFRTASVAINDFFNEEEVQRALDTARSVPQYYLVTIPIGTSMYIDSIPDSALGEQADFSSGYLPPGIVAAFVWDSRLVIVDDSNNMWSCEGGPVGWESFPTALKIPNTKGPVTAVINVQGERNQALVLVTGASSATLLSGSPDNPTSHVLGEGVGAYSQRCVSHYSGIAFAYNGLLWAIDQGRAVDFGGPVQELLPTPANTRLATSAKLSSLFVIDTNDGTCLRFHFPTQQWTVEERYATALGDLEDGVDAWISKFGSWSKGNTAVYGDDVRTTTRSSIAATLTKASDRVVTTSDIATAELHVGMPVCIVDSAGVAFATRIEVLDGATITTEDMAASGLTDGASESATVYFGAGATGLLLDTGPMDSGEASAISPKVIIDNLQGTGWEYGVFATKHPGDRDTIPTLLTYTTMSSESGARASGVRGRFQRVVLRNRKREAARIPLLEIEVK